ncbi:MAG TPA: CPBP family intramembrane glutamic endopeptidase [Polyangiaceae bacterium]
MKFGFECTSPWVLAAHGSFAVSGEPNAIEYWLNHPVVKALLPIPVFFAIAPAVWWFFRDTWKQLDVEAANRRIELADAGQFDKRPLVALVITAVVITLQEYYGGRTLYEDAIRTWLLAHERNGWTFLHVARFDELYGYTWWILARVIGYVVIPFPLWKLLFPKDSLLDLGLRTRGFTQHLWIYGLCLAIVVPTMLVVANQPDFGAYYPFYKLSSRSWFDFLAWEAMYYVQFFALELFFRGFLVGTLRHSLGSASIFVMVVPYCMIHFGKPYLEASGAIVAGIVLGSLAAKTKSIYAGFLVHVTVAASMDILSLWHRHGLPDKIWP